jgi:hypothetical protein
LSKDEDEDIRIILDGNKKHNNREDGNNAEEYFLEQNIQVYDRQERYFEKRKGNERNGDAILVEEIIMDKGKDDCGDCYDDWEKKWHCEIQKDDVFCVPKLFIKNNPNAWLSTKKTYSIRKKYMLPPNSYPKSLFTLTNDGKLSINKDRIGFDVSDNFISVLTEEYKNITDPLQRPKTIDNPDNWNCDIGNAYRNEGVEKEGKRILLNKLFLHYYNNTILLQRFRNSCIHEIF